MANVSTYETKKDGTSWRVKWREGGREGKPHTFTFYDEDEANRFRDLVNTCSNRLPSREQLLAFGFADLFESPQSRYVARV